MREMWDQELMRCRDFDFAGFSLNDCVVEIEEGSVRYLFPIHRAALELSARNYFGTEIGGYWLTPQEIFQLRQLPQHYPPNEAPLVAHAVEAYLRAQILA